MATLLVPLVVPDPGELLPHPPSWLPASGTLRMMPLYLASSSLRGLTAYRVQLTKGCRSLWQLMKKVRLSLRGVAMNR